ncbi:MAG TPA: DM13 domain-containing protein [Actinomycetota bacterium]|nr:DM13 domain-containing protein [Actinomycetota bacterium]
MLHWAKAHRSAAAAIAVAALALFGLGIYWFGPQRLVLDREVAEALPTPTAATDPSTGEEPLEEPSGIEELGSGEFRSLEHSTTGLARIVELEDGSRFVRLEDLDTSDGPDLRVYLTDQPVSDDWGVWDDGRYVDLGALKGNVGDSNYLIPEDVDPLDFRTVVIWCRRFTVGFGVAPI